MSSLQPIGKKAFTKLWSQREQSFQVHWSKLFNKLPCEIQNISKCEVIDFKKWLYSFLTEIPEDPLVGNLTPATCNIVTGRPAN